MRRWLPAVLGVAVFAGCFGATTANEASLGDLLPQADALAQESLPGSYLIMAVGGETDDDGIVEAKRSVSAGLANVEFTEKGDPDVGNGRSPLWMFVYADAASPSLFIALIAANGTVLVEAVSPLELPEGIEWVGPPAAELGLDSDEAMDRARADPTFRDLLSGMEEPLYASGLFGGPAQDFGLSLGDAPSGLPGSTWVVEAVDIAAYPPPDDPFDYEGMLAWLEHVALVVMDASTGEIAYAGMFPVDLMPPPDGLTFHEETVSGFLTPLESEVTFALPVARDWSDVLLTIEYANPQNLQGARFALLDGSGNVVVETDEPGTLFGRSGADWLQAADLPAGDYSVRVQLGRAMVYADFDLHVWVGTVSSEALPMSDGTLTSAAVTLLRTAVPAS